jgi:hypothetical protein
MGIPIEENESVPENIIELRQDGALIETICLERKVAEWNHPLRDQILPNSE